MQSYVGDLPVEDVVCIDQKNSGKSEASKRVHLAPPETVGFQPNFGRSSIQFERVSETPKDDDLVHRPGLAGRLKNDPAKQEQIDAEKRLVLVKLGDRRRPDPVDHGPNWNSLENKVLSGSYVTQPISTLEVMAAEFGKIWLVLNHLGCDSPLLVLHVVEGLLMR